MDALERAQNELYEAESAFDTSEAKDGNAFYRGLSEKHYQQAAVYAAVAQAEQLARIANNMERWLSVQHVLPEFFEHIDRVRAADADTDHHPEKEAS